MPLILFRHCYLNFILLSVFSLLHWISLRRLFWIPCQKIPKSPFCFTISHWSFISFLWWCCEALIFVIPVVLCWYHAPERVGISSNLPIWLPQGKPSPIRLSRDSGDSGDSFVHICWSPHTVASWCLGPWHLALCLGSLEQVWHLSLWHGCRAWSVWVGLDPEPAGANQVLGITGMDLKSGFEEYGLMLRWAKSPGL